MYACVYTYTYMYIYIYIYIYVEREKEREREREMYMYIPRAGRWRSGETPVRSTPSSSAWRTAAARHVYQYNACVCVSV